MVSVGIVGFRFGFLLGCVHRCQEVGLVDIQSEVACDKKVAAQKYLIENNCSEHVFANLDDLHAGLTSEGHTAYCKKHRQQCCVPGDPHLVCAGFPCAPFSRQRPGRCSTHRCWSTLSVTASYLKMSLPKHWQNHSESAAMWSTLRYVRAAQPIGGCLENVLGLDLSSETEASPLAVVVSELTEMGYATESVTINLDTFSTMVRPRSHF
eukprot:1455615-Amphidinium_carterae.2